MTDFPFTQARWIWSRDPGAPDHAVRRFLAALTLENAQTLRLFVSADSRYQLFFDGRPIGRGPARSDLRHYVYETYEVAADAGTHTLAAWVAAYSGASGPIAEMHDQGAWLLEAVESGGTVVCATGDERWRVHADTASAPVPVTRSDGYYGIGASERVDGRLVPHGWEQPGFDDGEWEPPVALFDAYAWEQPGDLADPGGRWRLVPRDIPQLREEPRQFTNWPGTVTVPANTRREIVVNAQEYAIGYPALQTEDGLGASVEIVYAEARTKDGVKGVRDDEDGTDVVGFADFYTPGGGSETYSPLHWRAFRFIKLVITTNTAPLTIRGFSYLGTGYPWAAVHAFTVENGPAQLPAVLETDFRTLECCTAETFMDCPYYEQLQYAGDTRLQALLSYVTTGDTRLGARAVKLFDWSRSPDGLTRSRYPSRIEQVIPPFSLLWVLMVEDLWRYAPAETATVEASLPGCAGVLAWFRQHLTADGVLGGHLPWWNFVDWAPGWDWGGSNGAPPPIAAGLPSATLNLQYLAALQAYSRLQAGFGSAEEAKRLQAEASALSGAIFGLFWDSSRGLLREGPGPEWEFTQHAQAWGILTGAIREAAWPGVAERLHTDDSLTPATFYHLFYVAEALAKADRLDQLWTRWLAPWRDALALHLSTWPEMPEPTRSDCHAWSAWPTYCFLTHVLGVQPSAPGFGAYTVTPKRVAGWDKIAGTAATPSGPLSISADWTTGAAQVTEGAAREEGHRV